MISGQKAKREFVGSISEVVKRKEETEIFEEDDSDEYSDTDLDTDDEEYQCAVCKLEFVGEATYEQHLRVSQHWG